MGAQRGTHADIPAGDSARILEAVTLLHDTEESEAPVLGRRVVIYGGGDTAMDAARTARRLGAEDAVVVYRRTRERMPANVEEVQDAVDEGVRLKWLSTIVGTGVSPSPSNGWSSMPTASHSPPARSKSCGRTR